MGALIDQYAVSGIRLKRTAGGDLHVTGSLTAELRAAIRQHKAALLVELAANDEPHYCWHVVCPDGRTFDLCALPERTLQQVTEMYPGAMVTEADEPRARPQHIADQLKTCTQCRNLSSKGLCLARQRGEAIEGTPRTYHPIPDMPKRCECYRPLEHEPDQRTGLERWPFLAPNYKPNQEPLDQPKAA